MQKITTFLWFDHQAEEAANFYVSLFQDSRILDVVRYGPEASGETGSVMTVTFQLEGQEFIALNGGPLFPFTPAISLFVNCADQAETDALWDRLLEGGTRSQCGWLQDKYGLSWQIIPSGLRELLSDPDPGRAGRAMKAMLGMNKIDIAAIRRAAEGEE